MLATHGPWTLYVEPKVSYGLSKIPHALHRDNIYIELRNSKLRFSMWFNGNAMRILRSPSRRITLYETAVHSSSAAYLTTYLITLVRLGPSDNFHSHMVTISRDAIISMLGLPGDWETLSTSQRSRKRINYLSFWRDAATSRNGTFRLFFLSFLLVHSSNGFFKP